MAKLIALPSLAIISGFKGTIDFYVHDGIPVARKWPRSPGKRRAPAVEAQWASWREAAGLWSLLSPEVQQAYKAMTANSAFSGRDVFTKSYLSGIYRNPHTPT